MMMDQVMEPVPKVWVLGNSTSTQVRPDLTEIGLTFTPKAFQLVATQGTGSVIDGLLADSWHAHGFCGVTSRDHECPGECETLHFLDGLDQVLPVTNGASLLGPWRWMKLARCDFTTDGIPSHHGDPSFMYPDCLLVILAFWMQALST
jgi:hypothetical protein